MCLSANKHTVLSLAVKAEVLQMENHSSCWHVCVSVYVHASVCTVHAREGERQKQMVRQRRDKLQG